MTDPHAGVRDALARYVISPPAGPFLLDVAATVTLDGAGAGVARIGPVGRQRWQLRQLAVSVDSHTNEPTAQVFLGAPAPGNFLAGTYTGSNDSTDLNIEVRPGGVIVIVWAGGDPGAIATASLYGQYTLV